MTSPLGVMYHALILFIINCPCSSVVIYWIMHSGAMCSKVWCTSAAGFKAQSQHACLPPKNYF